MPTDDDCLREITPKQSFEPTTIIFKTE